MPYILIELLYVKMKTLVVNGQFSNPNISLLVALVAYFYIKIILQRSLRLGNTFQIRQYGRCLLYKKINTLQS